MKDQKYTRLKFKPVSDFDIAFGTYPEDWFKKTLLTCQDGNKPWEDKANNLFFNGGTIPTNKELPKEYITEGIRLFKAIMGSWTPKHEDKENVCGQILRSLNEK